MKSSKYVHETVLNDNDFNEYQNVPQKEKNLNQRSKKTQSESQYQNVNTSEEILINNDYDVYSYDKNIFDMQNLEANANRYPEQNIELVCNCAINDTLGSSKARVKQQQCGEHDVILSTRSCCSTPKLGEHRTFGQHSLDRRFVKTNRHSHSSSTIPAVKHTYVYKKNSGGLRRHPSQKKIQSPEIINAHLEPNSFLYDSYPEQNCIVKSYCYEEDLKNDDYGFRKDLAGRASHRSNVSQGGHKKRIAGDGMDAQMDDVEIMFETSDHLRACRCPCDHVIYSPGYSCLQEDRLPPAPDVTRRLGSTTPLGKPDTGTPPYYRTHSATTNSSSTNSASSNAEARHTLIEKYFALGLHHPEILLYLRHLHNIHISLRTLKRILGKLNLFRRKNYSRIELVADYLKEQIQKSGQMHGYRWMHLKCLQNGFVVTQDVVRELLTLLDPQGVDIRKRKRLRRRQYFNKGPNFLWHVDAIIQHELDELVLEWNVHKIQKTKNCRGPTGRPMILFEMPSLYNTINYICEVPTIVTSLLEEECIRLKYPCDPDVFKLCMDIINEHSYIVPSSITDPYDALNLYITLRSKLYSFL